MTALVIEHATTTDMADGQPQPPIEGDAVWHIVDRADGHTRWRRIRLEQSRGDIAAISRDSSHGGIED
jgi:hypothetical protein